MNNATAQAAAIRVLGNAAKEQVVDVTSMQAFHSMMRQINITRNDYTLSLYYLATLNTMSHFGGVIDYTKHGFYHPGV